MDVVITYVDINDKFIQDFSKYVKQDLNEKRFRSYGVLDLQIKMIRKYMPYVNNIFVIVSDESQVPKNLDLNSCKIVYHKDIIPEKYLPCFNSCTIEMFMYRIPGLDEEFIYFNDDIFVINYINKEYFFKDGKPCLQFEIKDYSYNETEIYKTNLFNSTKEISKLLRSEKKFDGKYIKMAHSCRPFLKSTCEKVFNKLNFKLISSLTRTRHSKNFNATIFNDYDYMSLNYVNQYPNYTYIESCGKIDKIIDTVNKKETPIICINDNDDYIDFDEFKENLNRLFNANLEKKEYIKLIKTVKEEIITLDNTPLKVALCAIAKNENLYIREWVDYYKNLGISKIFLYDNNELDGERFEDVINDYIKNGFVEVINRRGITKTIDTDKEGQTLQGLSYSDCYISHYKEFDWICFFDIDEFLEIDNKFNLFSFLNIFNNDEYDGIHIQWKMYGDNNLLYYDNRSVYERFYHKQNLSSSTLIKTILKGKKHFKNDLLFCAHGPLRISGRLKQISIINVDGSEAVNPYRNKHKLKDNMIAYLNHFYCKSTEEFINRKWKKTSAVTGINLNRNFDINFLKDQYFKHNMITDAKLQLFENLINEKKIAEKIDKKDKIIVNFTTWKKRDIYIPLLLKYFTNQTLKPDKIICWLSNDEYHGIIPESIQYCLDNNLLTNVFFVDGNIYGHKRYETFKYNNDAYNIFMDDDLYYPIDYVELLYKACKENPKNAICYYSRHEMYKRNGIRSFTDATEEPSFENRYFSGLAAFPPNIFPIESFNYANLRDKYCPKCDDSWINGWLFKYKIKVKAIYTWGKKSPLNVIGDTQEDGIYETHNGLKINGIMQAAINIANAVVVTHTEKIANEIWPEFNIYDITTCIERI